MVAVVVEVVVTEVVHDVVFLPGAGVDVVVPPTQVVGITIDDVAVVAEVDGERGGSSDVVSTERTSMGRSTGKELNATDKPKVVVLMDSPSYTCTK